MVHLTDPRASLGVPVQLLRGIDMPVFSVPFNSLALAEVDFGKDELHQIKEKPTHKRKFSKIIWSIQMVY